MHEICTPQAVGDADEELDVDSGTRDPCTVDVVCATANRVCWSPRGAAECGYCLTGFHIEGSFCLPDRACEEDSCLGRGTCDDSFGYPVCTCDLPYTGLRCELCNEASGWWSNRTLGVCTREFVTIRAGDFWMGSPDGCPGPEGYPGDCTEEYSRDRALETLHPVRLTYDFEIMPQEVTQREWLTAFDYLPSYFYDPVGIPSYPEGTLSFPLDGVNRFEAMEYANWLSALAGLPPCYILSLCTGIIGIPCRGISQGYCSYGPHDPDIYYCGDVTLNGVEKPQDCEGYRLPTSAEWEYAARAGSTTAFHPSATGDGTYSEEDYRSNVNPIAWWASNCVWMHPVGTKEPNFWGLYDMSGNVYEMVWDALEYPAPPVPEGVDVDPIGSPFHLGEHVARGGSWYNGAELCRSASIFAFKDSVKDWNLGFRLVRTL